ncbi:MAG TPA: hypothetical protein DCX06_07785 [Opitutae bacterium]|nr:hypothetical protein [Opitutae bacterium]
MPLNSALKRLALCLFWAAIVVSASAVSPRLAIQSGHEGELDLIATSRSGTLAATASIDGKVTLWDIATQQKLYSATPITAKRPVVQDIQFVGSNDHSIAFITTSGIYFMDTANPEAVKNTPQRGLSASAVSEDRATIYYAATQFGKVIIKSVRVQTGKVSELISHKPEDSHFKLSRKSTISTLEISPNGSKARIVLEPEGSVHLYDLRSNWPLPDDAPQSDFETPDTAKAALGSNIIASAPLPGSDRHLVIAQKTPKERLVAEYSTASQTLQAWQSDTFQASSLRSLRDGSGFLVLSDDGYYSVRMTIGELRVQYHAIAGFKDIVSLNETNQVAYISYTNDQATLCFSEIGAKTPTKQIPVEVGYVLDNHTVQIQLALSADGTHLAAVSASRANVFDTASGDLLHQRQFEQYLYAENTTMQSAAFNGQNDTLYITTKAGLIDINFDLDFARVIDSAKYTHLHPVINEREPDYAEVRGIDLKTSQARTNVLVDYSVQPLVNAPPRPLVVDWANDGDLVAIRGAKAIHIFKPAEQGKQSAELALDNTNVEDITLFNQGTLCAALNTEGSLTIWDIQSSEQLGTLVLNTASNEWIFATKQGYFESSPGGLHKASFIIGKTLVPTAAFFEVFHSPKLAWRMIQGYRPPAPESAMSQFNTPPSIDRIEVADAKGNRLDPSVEIKTDTLALRVYAESNAATISEIRLYHNEKLISNKTRGLFVEDDDATTARSEGFNVQLLPGVNTFKAIAYNAARSESKAEKISLTYKPNFDDITGINLHMLLVGINEYKNPKYNLNYAVADAKAVSNLLQNSSKHIYTKTHVHTLTNKEATKDKILDLIDKVKSASGPRDTFIFYYAGHGVVSEDATFYLVPTEVTQLYGADEALTQKGIPSELLFAASRDIPAQKQLFILDACQSAGALTGLSQRGAAEEKAIAQLARSTGTHWLTASGSQQFATEFSELGHGAFTYTLLRGLEGKADSGDGRVTVNELKAYLESEVPVVTSKYKGTAQYPASYGYGQDFPITLP